MPATTGAAPSSGASASTPSNAQRRPRSGRRPPAPTVWQRDAPSPAASRAAARARPEPRGPAPDPGDVAYDKAIQPDRERPDAQPGALLRATVDTDHWLSAGSDGETQVVIEGARVFAPIKLNAGRNVVYYAPKSSLVASGLIWPEGQDLLVRKAYLMHQPFGQGHVIALRRGPELPRLHRSDDAAVHERGAAGPGLLTAAIHARRLAAPDTARRRRSGPRARSRRWPSAAAMKAAASNPGVGCGRSAAAPATWLTP